ncbi:MAG: hypothetical protein ABEJ75_04265 [Candidatus Nanohaloarchaea archaeon]
MAVATFGGFLQTLQQMDFFTLLLPFVVTYVVALFALRNVDLFGDENNAPAIIALAVAFFAAQFIAQKPFYQKFFVQFFGRLTVGFIGLLGVMTILGMAGATELINDHKTGLGIILILAVLSVFTFTGGLKAIFPYQIPFGQAIQAFFESGLVWLVIVGALVYWTSTDQEGGMFGTE